MAVQRTRQLPGLNLVEPWSNLILSGDKTIETRTYACPVRYLNHPVLLVDTPKKKGSRPATILGVVVFSNCKLYSSIREFRLDAKKHRIEEGGDFDWNGEKPKWGWVVEAAWKLRKPIAAPRRRGYVWTGPLTIQESILPVAVVKRLSSSQIR